MSSVMSTSQWIGFFKKAGLPANVAANYAVIFSDNRIQIDMLLDLSKEYLFDMGIKVMGDVIAILKYAKELHNQLVQEKLIGNSSASGSPNTNRAVAERMVGRYTRPLPPPVRTNVGIPERVAQNDLRGSLGHKTVRNQPIPERGTTSKPKVISLKRKPGFAEEVPVRKIRRVPPEEEGGYKIKMPAGTTERTRKILEMQQQLSQGGPKRSVFARLGDSAVSSSTDTAMVSSSSVFERLGPSSKHIRDDTPSSTVLNDVVRKKGKGAPLQYRGVLKMTVGQNRTVMTSSNIRAQTAPRTVIKSNTPRNLNIVKTVKLNQINTILNTNRISNSPVLRTAKPGSAGILGQRRVQGLDVKSRLGEKVDARNMARTKLIKGKLRGKSNVFSRLGQ